MTYLLAASHISFSPVSESKQEEMGYFGILCLFEVNGTFNLEIWREDKGKGLVLDKARPSEWGSQ